MSKLVRCFHLACYITFVFILIQAVLLFDFVVS